MTAPQKQTTTTSARRKMELSQITRKAVQQEAMGTDVNMTDFALQFQAVVKVPHIAERITDATIQRTIDGSSTLTLVINDYDRALLQSDQLANRLDVQIDGLWFRLTGADKQGDQLTLTFEDREIAVLRTYSRWKYASRDKVTRAEFVYSMIREVKEFDIPCVIPELHMVQPLQRYDGDTIGYDTIINKTKGMPTNPQGTKKSFIPIPSLSGQGGFNVTLPSDLTAKGSPLDKEQKQNAETIVAVGQQMKVGRKLQVVAIMTAITESVLHNLSPAQSDPTPGTSSAGLFQQQAGWGSLEERTDPATSSRLFYNAVLGTLKANPNATYTELCWMTQHPRADLNNVYSKYRTEAEQIVTACGVPGGDNEAPAATVNGQSIQLPTGAQFYFWRGNIVDRSGQRIRKPENTWTCIQRLADEVDWKAFFVSGTFYFISEDSLLKAKPLLTLDESADGILDVSGDFHNNKKAGTLTITALAGRWSIPPGCVVIVDSMGIFNGRWLVSEYDRDLFTLNATITLSRKTPALPEPAPAKGNIADIQTWVKTPSTPQATKTPQGTIIGPTPQYDQKRAELAKQLLALNGHGWTDYNTGVQQMRITAQGGMVDGAIGPVYLDPKVIAVVLWLIQSRQFNIGTFAWCSDHSNDGRSGHAGGHAVDIAAINGVSINTDSLQCYTLTYTVATMLHNLKGQLAPRQLITGGYGGHRDSSLTALSITDPRGENPDSYYGSGTMGEHCNHIHVGY